MDLKALTLNSRTSTQIADHRCSVQCELSLGPSKEPPYLLKWMNGCEFGCLVHSFFDESLFELEGDFVHSGEDDESPAGL